MTWPAPDPWHVTKCQAWASSTVYRPGGPFAGRTSIRLSVLGSLVALHRWSSR